jgi:hypothetical protein
MSGSKMWNLHYLMDQRGLTFQVWYMESIEELKNSQVHYNLRGDLVKHLKAMKGFNIDWNKIIAISCLPLSMLFALFQFYFMCACQKCLSTPLCECFRVCEVVKVVGWGHALLTLCSSFGICDSWGLQVEGFKVNVESQRKFKGCNLEHQLQRIWRLHSKTLVVKSLEVTS